MQLSLGQALRPSAARPLAVPTGRFQSASLLPMRRGLPKDQRTSATLGDRLSAYVLQTAGLHDRYTTERPSSDVAYTAALPAQQLPSLAERLRHNLASAIAAGLRLTSLAVRFVSALIHSGALQAWVAQLGRQQLAAQQQRLASAAAEALLARQASRRDQAAAREPSAAAQPVSDAERAFCSMILRQDNPQRSLEDKWADLRAHMHGEGAQPFRHVTGQLFASACVSCATVQAALAATDPADICSCTASLNKLVDQHTCVQQEEAMRSMVFAQVLAAQQQ